MAAWAPRFFSGKNNEELLIKSLATLNIRAERVAWNQSDVDWTQYQACIVRSTWDYHESKEKTSKFLSTLHKIEELNIPLLNLHCRNPAPLGAG